MKYHAIFVIFEKSSNIFNCRLLQIIGGTLWVKSESDNTCHFAFKITTFAYIMDSFRL